ncbi:hypothetical protein BC941DRAFT_502047 [Chlamydoabsidia padenii]|nr:hypothetical protein BC941DRAFT_502047 [Chlamydoabsidia padenii]
MTTLFLFLTYFTAILSTVIAGVLKRQIVSTADMLYTYNPPRVNPDYCIGFRITYPTYPGQAFEAKSLQQVSWEVDRDIPHSPDSIFRIRILNSTQHNELVLGENLPIYTKGNTGSTEFHLDVDDRTGMYHYRVMVNYPGTTTHCVFESVPFMILQNPYEIYHSAGAKNKTQN